ncbi:transposase [[Kitasatospora] papulosa]|uniref:transposase n=1 Tax=[Kitasatospora] papulosa TaxID=1464011 RepID=UPI0036C34C15
MRNWHREKALTMQAEDLDLAIPNVRTGSFFPSLLERRCRIDRPLYTVIMETWVHGSPLAAWTTGSGPWAGTPASPRARAPASAVADAARSRCPPTRPLKTCRRRSSRH